MFKVIFVYSRSIYRNFFAVDNRCAYKRHIVMVTLRLLVYFTACGTVKAEPGGIKGTATPPRQSIAELSDCGLQSRECASENAINGNTITKPIDGMWVESRKRLKNSRAEIVGGFTKDDKALNSKSAKDANKHNNHGDRPSWDDYFHAAILSLLSVLIPMIPVFMQKHNEFTGRVSDPVE